MCTAKQLDFAIFIIYALAERWNKSPVEVYSILNSSKILDDYIIEHYNTLHTLGKNYLIKDITEFVIEKGVVL